MENEIIESVKRVRRIIDTEIEHLQRLQASESTSEEEYGNLDTAIDGLLDYKPPEPEDFIDEILDR